MMRPVPCFVPHTVTNETNTDYVRNWLQFGHFSGQFSEVQNLGTVQLWQLVLSYSSAIIQRAKRKRAYKRTPRNKSRWIFMLALKGMAFQVASLRNSTRRINTKSRTWPLCLLDCTHAFTCSSDLACPVSTNPDCCYFFIFTYAHAYQWGLFKQKHRLRHHVNHFFLLKKYAIRCVDWQYGLKF